jgi:hypothetical protein
VGINMLTRREILLTQICLIEKNHKKEMMEQAMRQIPMILKVLGLEETTENELFNLMIELESSRTEITLKINMNLRKDHRKDQ